MSGSGGGSWTPPEHDSCETLSQVTVLNSPQKNVIARIKKGDLLVVHVNKAARNTVVVEALYKGDVAGTITSSIIQQLAECIEQGHAYVAEVLDEVRGGACRVQVRKK